MKFYLRIFFLVFVIGIICIGELEAEKINGYYISKSNDTIKVTFNIPIYFKLSYTRPDYALLQTKVKCYDLATNQKKKLNPYEVKEISFNYKGDDIKMLSRHDNLELDGQNFSDDRRVFIHLVKDGKLKLFRYYSSSGYGNPSVASDILQKENEELFRIRFLFFKKDMVDYLSDCPELVRKIDEKTYKGNDIEQIVDLYNNTCK